MTLKAYSVIVYRQVGPNKAFVAVSIYYFIYTGQKENHWFVQGDQPQEKKKNKKQLHKYSKIS